jgi:protein-S-isoprenylcysteine O-methyltransferase Ste14
MEFIVGIFKVLAFIIIGFIIVGFIITGIIKVIESKIITEKRFYIIIVLSAFLCGFLYNLSLESGTFINALEGGTVVVFFLLIGYILLVVFPEYFTNKKKRP